MQSSHASASGGVGGGGRWCHLGVVGVIPVSYPEYARVYTEYIFVYHTPSALEYTPVSFPGHTQFSRHTRVSGDQTAADDSDE